MIIDHIAIIVSSEEGVEFYKSFGFMEINRVIRNDCNHDEIILLQGNGCLLEIYKDSEHPARVSTPEAYGLRHLCFCVSNLDEIVPREFIRFDSNGNRYGFVYDPDSLPIEFRERSLNS